MAYNAYHLSIFFDIPQLKERAEKMITSIGNAITRYPTSFGVWANLLAEIIYGTEEIAVVGKNSFSLASRILAEYIPHKVIMISLAGNEKLPLLAGKQPSDPPLIYLCKAYSCLKPVSEVNELVKLLNIRNKN
jgi:uncharacterized protein YyaL (SSP411 family)